MASLSRGSLQKLALVKIQDARLLFENGRYSNSYYLYGYGIELGLKACIARQILAETVPDTAILKGFLTHRFDGLVALAGLKSILEERRKDPDFDLRWAVISEWREDSRYEMIDVVVATTMRDAVEHPSLGVMAWLQHHW